MDFDTEISNEKENDRLTLSSVVTDDMLECAVGCGDTHTLSMSSMVSLMEKTSMQLVKKHIPKNCTTVGVLMNLTHTAPTSAGVEIFVTAELMEKAEGQFYLELTMRDNMGIICEATHQRVIVPLKLFDEKARMRSGFFEKKRTEETHNE